MKKMPCLFQRDFTNKRQPTLLDAVTPGCEWVLAGEGVATRKWDGTACMVRWDKLYRRYDAKGGKQPPPGFVPAQDPDPITGHWPGWIEVNPHNPDPSAVWIALAWWASSPPNYPQTYEACGPKIGGNERSLTSHVLIPHGRDRLLDAPRTFEGLREYLQAFDGEGLVFWRHLGDPNSEMCKIRRDDYGFDWPIK